MRPRQLVAFQGEGCLGVSRQFSRWIRALPTLLIPPVGYRCLFFRPQNICTPNEEIFHSRFDSFFFRPKSCLSGPGSQSWRGVDNLRQCVSPASPTVESRRQAAGPQHRPHPEGGAALKICSHVRLTRPKNDQCNRTKNMPM